MGCCLEKFYTGSPVEEKSERPDIRLLTSTEEDTESERSGQQRVVALYDYTCRGACDISFNKWDQLTLISNEDEWWLVKHLKTEEQGYVPSNYVALAGSLQSEKWFFGKITRKDSERLLFKQGIKGCFLIRESETARNSFSLSLLNDDSEQSIYVKHYRIRTTEKGSFYITEGVEFIQLVSLIKHFQEAPHGLCCRLAEPCDIRENPLTYSLGRNVFEIEESQVRILEEVESGVDGKLDRALWNDKVVIGIKTYTYDVSPTTLDAMRKLHNKSIVKFYGTIPTKPVSLCWEYLDRGRLPEYLKDGEFRMVDLIDIAAQVASGMAYLEAAQFAHKYLRARSVMVGEDHVFKVADYGVHESPLEIDPDATLWLSPDAIQNHSFDTKSDVWTFGILVTEVISRGEKPYSGTELSKDDLLEKLLTGFRMPRQEQCPEALYELLVQCWDSDRDLRPTFEYIQIFLESFFQRADFADNRSV